MTPDGGGVGFHRLNQYSVTRARPHHEVTTSAQREIVLKVYWGKGGGANYT